MITHVALLGLGEVGRVLAEELQDQVTLSAWDTAFDDATSRASANAAHLPIRVGADARDAASDAQLIISAVTAANDLAAAQDVAGGMSPGTWFLDLNSASPQHKRDAAAAVEGALGRYVEAAVMSPIEPDRLGSPILLGGPHASSFVTTAAGLGFSDVTFYSDVVGLASATKLCRSVVVKGVEALLTESLLAARAWGVEAQVLASLSNLLPAADWPTLAHYMISRSVQHGARRSEEMDEAAATVSETGVEPLMSTAAARRQAWAAAHRDAIRAPDLASMLDAMRKAGT